MKHFYKPNGGTLRLLPPLNSSSGIIHPVYGIYYIRIPNDIKAKRLRLERKEKLRKIYE